MQRRTPEEKRAQKQALLEQADKGLAALADSLISSQTTTALRDWLRFAARFHSYSFRNQLLIAAQRDHPSGIFSITLARALRRIMPKSKDELVHQIQRIFSTGNFANANRRKFFYLCHLKDQQWRRYIQSAPFANLR